MDNISGVVRVPNYIKENYQEFTQFIDDFYKHMEEDNGFLRALIDFNENKEALNEGEVYIDKLLNNLGFAVGQEIKCSKKLLICSLRDFYLSRGSPRSFVFLFRTLFGETPTIKYPRDELFVPSESLYGTSQYILLTSSEQNKQKLSQFLGDGFFALSVKGRVSNVSASIEDVRQIVYNGSPCLYVRINDNNGLFVPNELVDITDGESNITETIFNSVNLILENGGHGYAEDEIIKIDTSNGYAKILACSGGSVNSVNIIMGGSGYQRNQTIISNDTQGGGFFAIIDDVDVYGSITSVKIIDKGYGFKTLPLLTINGTGSGAKIEAQSTTIGAIKKIQIMEGFFDVASGSVLIQTKSGNGATFTLDYDNCVFKEQGKHLTKTGFLGVASNLHDSLYNQNYSYVLSSGVSNVRYAKVVDEYVHPVGYIRYGVYNLVSGQLDQIQISSYGYLTIIKNLFSYSTFTNEYGSESVITIGFDTTNNAKLYPINNIDYYKYSNLFSWPINDFQNDIISNMTSEIPENRTIDPEITIL